MNMSDPISDMLTRIRNAQMSERPSVAMPASKMKASIAKVYATEAGYQVVDAMMQILGGMGMTKEMPLEHWFRGLRVARVVEGPSEIQRFLVARDMLGAAALGRAS